MSDPLEVHVDPDRCEGHGLCAAAVSEVFELGDDDLVTYQKHPPAQLLPAVRIAAATCPRAAITVSARE